MYDISEEIPIYSHTCKRNWSIERWLRDIPVIDELWS
jgi:hypothetical protein